MAAQAIFPPSSHSGCYPADRRGHFQHFAGAWAVDAPARTRFVRARRADAAKADREDAWMDQAQMERARTHKKRAGTLKVPARFVFGLCGVAAFGAKGVTQMPM